MSRFRCYITPFLESGEYGEEIEVTNDVSMSSLKTITQQIDGNDYDIGVLTFNDLDLVMRNDHGYYSKPEVPESIFRYKRSDTIFRMTWEIEDEGCICGLAIAGKTRLNEPIEVYRGLVNDESAMTDVKTHITRLKVLGMESIVSRVETPFGDFYNGMLTSEAILLVLNQELITDIITVDAANISLDVDTAIDDVASFESLTGKEAMDILLLISNSTFYVKDSTAYVVARDPSADVEYEFYGIMSTGGLENIQNISTIKSGMEKMFNFMTWNGQTFSVQDATSISKYGVRKKEVSSDCITNTTKQQNILATIVTEFGTPAENFILSTPVNRDTLALFFLDRVSVDYPTVFVPIEGQVLPTYDVSNYDEAYYPMPESVLTIESSRRFKIMGVDIKLLDQIIDFKLREIV